MPGAAARTHGPVYETKKYTSLSHHRSSRFTGIPRANGFNGFLRALSGEPGFFATIASKIIISQA